MTVDSTKGHVEPSVTGSGEVVDDLIHRLRAAGSSVTSRQHEIAEFVISQPEQVAMLTASELGGVLGVSDSTIVRFCQRLGYSGYHELRKVLREALFEPRPTFHDELERFRGVVAKGGSGLLDATFQGHEKALSASLAGLDALVMERCARVLAEAEKVAIIAPGLSSFIGQVLEFHLLRLGINAVWLSDEARMPLHLGSVTDKCVVFGISYWRFIDSIHRWLTYASGTPAKTIVLADRRSFPSASAIDYVLTVSSRSLGHVPSLLGALAVVESLVALIMAEDFDGYELGVEQRDRVGYEVGLFSRSGV